MLDELFRLVNNLVQYDSKNSGIDIKKKSLNTDFIDFQTSHEAQNLH